MKFKEWMQRDLSFNTYLEQMLQAPIYKARQILKQSSLDAKSKREVWETYKNMRYLNKLAKRKPIDTKLPSII